MKPLQDEQEYLSKRDELVLLLTLAQEGYIQLYFGDESGFSLQPTVPYGWIKKGQQACILAQRSPRLNVFGLLSTDSHLVSYQQQESITTEFVITCLDDFAQGLSQATVVVLDNAPMHTSVLFQSKLEDWQAKGLSIFFLPKYSPHLNRIERLWKQIKYHWLKAKDYASFDCLKKAVQHSLAQFGNQFNLQFNQ